MRETKRYVQHYYVDQGKENTISIKWKSGLYDFEIFVNNVLLETYKNTVELSKGVFIYSENLGNIFIRMLQKPFGFEVKCGDRYLFNSRILSEEKLTSVSVIFYFIGTISTITSLLIIISHLSFGEKDMLISFLLFIDFIISVFYLTAGYLIKKRKTWAYFTGLSIFVTFTILYLLIDSFNAIPLHLLRIIFIVIILSQIKYMLDIYKHQKALKNYLNQNRNEDVLDNFNL